MNNDNRLLQSILQSGSEQAEEIKAEAADKAAQTLADAEQAARAEAESIRRKAADKAAGIGKAAAGSAALIRRNAVLNAKRQEINAAIDGIYDYVGALDDARYFELLYRIAGSVGGTYDEIRLNRRDLERLPADFTARFGAAGVTAVLSDTAADISGGFLLKSGDIETNCSLEAIVEDKRSEIEDFIHSALFAQEGE